MLKINLGHLLALTQYGLKLINITCFKVEKPLNYDRRVWIISDMRFIKKTTGRWC